MLKRARQPSRLLKNSIENTSHETKESIQENLRKDRIGYEFYTKPSYSDGRSKSFFISLLERFIQGRSPSEIPIVAPISPSCLFCRTAHSDQAKST